MVRIPKKIILGRKRRISASAYSPFSSLAFFLWVLCAQPLYAQQTGAETNQNTALIENVHKARKAISDGAFDQALALYTEAFEILQNQDGETGDNHAFLLNEMSVLYRKQGQRKAALESAKKAVAAALSAKRDGAGLAPLLINLGQAQHDANAFRDSLNSFVEAEEILPEGEEYKHLRIIALREQGNLQQVLGNVSLAELIWEAALELTTHETSVSEQQIELRQLLVGAALLQFETNSARRRLTLLQQSLSTVTNSSSKIRRQTDLLEIRLLVQIGELSNAERRLAKFLSLTGESKSELLLSASAHYNWAEIHFARGDFIASNSENRKAERIYAEILERHHYIFAQVDHRRAVLMQEVGDVNGAIALYDRSLEKFEALLGRDHPLWVSTQTERCRALARQGQVDLAILELNNILSSQILGRPKLLARSALGLILFEDRRLSEAEPELLDAVADWLTFEYGPTDIPPTLTALAELQLETNRPKLALQTINQSLEIISAMGGDSIARSSEANRIKSKAQSMLGNHDAALETSRQNFEVAKRQLKLMGFSTGAAAEYSPRLVREQLAQFMDLLWRDSGQKDNHSDKHLELLFEAAQLVHHNETGRAAHRAIRSVSLDNKSTLSKRSALLDSLASFENQHKHLQKTAEAKPRELSELRRKAENIEIELIALEADLREKSPELLAYLSPSLINLKDLRASLTPGEVVWLQASFEESSYLFWVTNGAVKIEHVEVGSQYLEILVNRVRSTLDLKGKKVLPEFDAESSALLFETLFGSFSNDLVATDKLYTMPDLAVQQLSLATLVVGAKNGGSIYNGQDNRKLDFLGHKVPLSILPAVDLLVLENRRAKSRSVSADLVGFGDPLLTGSQNMGTRGLSDAYDRLTGMADPSILRQVFEPLEESRYELERMQEVRPNQATQFFFGAEASETNLKALDLSSVGTLVFATHALVAGDFENLHEPSLVLSPPKVATSLDDGLLLASEIATMNIGARLVVLSACNTGAASGRATAPGLSGLARAFMIAGAESLIVSHWTISTFSSILITPKLYEFMEDGNDIAPSQALQKAMVYVVVNSKDPFFAHPSIWGAFSAVGAN